jgi:hypothetical protein
MVWNAVLMVKERVADGRFMRRIILSSLGGFAVPLMEQNLVLGQMEPPSAALFTKNTCTYLSARGLFLYRPSRCGQ